MKILEKSIVPIVLFCLSLGSCYYDSEEFLYPQSAAPCDTININYSSSVRPALDNFCISCHSNITAPALGGNIRLEDYADVKARADDSRLVGSIFHKPGYSPMPKGASMLDDCTITMIKKWVDSGAPND